nr:low temperature requirement protein A [Gordonia araii]
MNTTSIARRERLHRSEVGPIELFFDLVYVFAIIQLSHLLLHHLTWLGALQTAVLFFAVWWAWNYSAWAMNWLNPGNGAVRILNASLMLLGLGMAIVLPDAFGDKGLLFACFYVAAQVIRPLFMMFAFRGEQLAANYRNLLAWSASAGLLWLFGGLLEPDLRLVVWISALFIDYFAPRAGYRFPLLGSAPMRMWDVDAEHLAERNRLVFIIALGESILVMGFTLSGLSVFTPVVIVSAIVGFGCLYVLWWNYFALDEGDTRHGGKADTGVLRSAYAYAHSLMVAGAIVLAVSIEMLLTREQTDRAFLVVSVAGPMLYLMGNVLFLRSRSDALACSRYGAMGVLLLTVATSALFGEDMSPLVPAAAIFVVMAALGIYTQYVGARTNGAEAV